ncbi:MULTISPECIES: CPBP family intramembrane glutamic endopeptidase [unclassified Synechocystis]|uniref:CPBP family intramembrane glutamic endopeptidase n=1 Tax=unclassified Synechocystis TaxID=2640012 RepID=UPI0004D18A17|nr:MULTISPECIES: CPBP family intramembrane glutamic endopeptidase [unclassified Synechocystis]AIE73165.1 Abortive infection protein [Synechocystis sp. PCC 6714]
MLGRKLGWQPWQAVTPAQKLPLVLSLYCVSPLPIWAVTQWEYQSLGDYGLHFSSAQLLSLAIAVVVAVLGLGLTLAVQGKIGLLQWHREKWWDLVKLSPLFLILALAIALVEELIFRGIFQNQLQQDLPAWVAAMVISAIFAVLHLLWERRLTAYQLPGLWLLGMVLVWARLVDGGNLALAWGLHGGWVFALAACDATGLITYPCSNGNIWVGKANQPLAGLAGIICLLLTALAIAFLPRLSPLWPGV